jgi:hypothetical protein
MGCIVRLDQVARYQPGNSVLPYHNRNLVCDEGIRLDYCDVITTTGDYGMTIITLGRLYFVLSYRLAPIDALSVQYERRASSGATCVFTGPHL